MRAHLVQQSHFISRDTCNCSCFCNLEGSLSHLPQRADVLSMFIKNFYFKRTNLPQIDSDSDSWILIGDADVASSSERQLFCIVHIWFTCKRMSGLLSFQKFSLHQCRHAPPQGLHSYHHLGLELPWPTKGARLTFSSPSSLYSHKTLVRPPYLKLQTLEGFPRGSAG